MPDGQTFTLTTGADTVSGGDGVNTIVATDGTLSAGDQIDGGSSGQNVLSLQGAGTFDLTQPATLTDIGEVDASEVGGTTFQAVTMRSGLNLTVDVNSVTNGQIYIYGANDSDVFNLGGGIDVVTLGSASETVNGGGGSATVNLTAATAGALVTGQGGSTTLDIYGGGTIAFNSADSQVQQVILRAASTGYTLATTTEDGQTVLDNTTSDDIIQLNAPTDVLRDRAANVTTQVTAANAGATIYGGTGADVVEITTGGTVTLNPLTTHVSVLLTAATSLTLNTHVKVVTGSSGNDTITLTTDNLTRASALNGGGGSNTLVLSGSGAFHLEHPGTLTNFQTIDATEGTAQIVYSRVGLAATIDVLAAPSGATDNAITLNGAADQVVFDLGSGVDTVNLGSSNETVNCGSGTAIILTKAAAAGALINGGSGTTTLTINGGGNAVMNAADTGISSVVLAATPSTRSFTASAQAGLSVEDLGSGVNTITAGGADQTFTGGRYGRLTMIDANAGYDTLTDTAATMTGDTVQNFQQIGNAIDVTDLDPTRLTATFTENAGDTAAELVLTDNTHAVGLTLTGQYITDSLPAAGIVVGSDGKGGTLLEYAGTTSVTLDGSAGNRAVLANAAGDTLIGGAGDTLTGGAGADTFVFHAGFGLETVNAFTTSGANADVLQFDSSVFADWAHVLGATAQQGSDLTITLDPGDVITLKNVSLANFTAQDVKFV